MYINVRGVPGLAALLYKSRACYPLQVSMMDGRLFDTLETVARKVRGSNAPFGGIQVGLARPHRPH